MCRTVWVFACAIALFTSAIQVFVRDVAQILPPLMTFWFFTTPILYSSSYLPALMQKFMYWNPMAWFVARLRELLLFGEVSFDYKTLLFVMSIAIFACYSVHLALILKRSAFTSNCFIPFSLRIRIKFSRFSSRPIITLLA